MRTRLLRFRPFRVHTLTAGLVALLLGACGGGSGDQAGVGTGGTGTIASGPISGFGSVIVAGVHFDDTNARVSDEDGTPRQRQDLKLGMVAAITGSADFAAASGVAATIRYGSEALGPVTALDLSAGSLTVLGAHFRVKATTLFDEGLAGLGALKVGDLVEVYGFYNAASGSFTATRIEAPPSALRYRLRGPVTGLDEGARRFTLAGVSIDYAGIPAGALPPLGNGLLLRASSSRPPAGGVWRVEALTPAQRTVLAEGETRVVSDISALTSATSFVLDGVPVDAAAATIHGSLAVGVRVEVEGSVRQGILVAKEVEVSDGDASSGQDFDLTDKIQDFDAASLRFRLRGQRVDAAGPVIYTGGSRADLANGRRIELKGYYDAVSGAVVATRIEFEN